jgi:hypothetical protein
LAFVLRELPVFGQHIKTSTARLRLLVRPLIHAKFAFDIKFLTFLDQFAEIFSRFAPYLKVDERSDLLFFALRVGVILVVGQRGRENSFTVRGVSEFWVSGDVASDEDFVEIYSDLGFRFDVIW